MADGKLQEKILDRAEQSRAQYEQLVVLVGPAGSGKTSPLPAIERKVGYPYRSVGFEASRRLHDVPTPA